MRLVFKLLRYSRPAGLAVALLIVEIGGCAQTPIRQYPVQPVDSYSQTESRNGLTVAIKPVTDKQELLHYFGFDLRDSGVLSIYVVIENSNTKGSFIVSDGSFVLGEETSSENMHSPDDKNIASPTGGGAIAIGSFVTPLIVFPPVFIAGAHLANDASRKNLNVAINKFQTGTVSPGETEYGFAYFQVPKEINGNMVFMVTLDDLGSSDQIDFSFNIDTAILSSRE